MAFGMELQNYFSEFTHGYEHLTEEEMNAKLDDAFILLSKKYTNYHIKLIHGARSHVEFMHGSLLIRKELADMMFLVYNKTINRCKLMYLQNKNAGTSTGRPYEFDADLEQYYLLHHRPSLILTRYHPSCVPHRNVLKRAVVYSVGAYGVFCKNDKSNDYFMHYYPADLLSKIPTYKNRLTYSAPHYRLDTCRKFGSETDSFGCSSVGSFGDELVNFHIGTPISAYLYAQIVDVLSSRNYPCEEYREVELYRIGRNTPPPDESELDESETDGHRTIDHILDQPLPRDARRDHTPGQLESFELPSHHRVENWRVSSTRPDGVGAVKNHKIQLSNICMLMVE